MSESSAKPQKKTTNSQTDGTTLRLTLRTPFVYIRVQEYVFFCTLVCHNCHLSFTIKCCKQRCRSKCASARNARGSLGTFWEWHASFLPLLIPEWTKTIGTGPSTGCNPQKLVGKTTRLNIVRKLGLPNTLTKLEGIGLWRAMKKALAGENPALAWLPPIQSALQLKLTLPDFQELGTSCTRMSSLLYSNKAFLYIYVTFICLLFYQIAYFPYTNVTFLCFLCTQMTYCSYTNATSKSNSPSHCHVEDSPRRLKQQTLRAMPLFQKKLALDYVKMDVDMGDENGPNYRSYFGRCMCFFRDANGDHFVALRWLAEAPGVIIDPTTRLAPLTLSPAGSTDSYSVMSCAAIQNGASFWVTIWVTIWVP